MIYLRVLPKTVNAVHNELARVLVASLMSAAGLSGRSNFQPAFDAEGLENLVEVSFSQLDLQELRELGFC